MDSRCKARFDGISYYCRECSKDCLIRKAKKLVEKGYDGIFGVACSNEIKLGVKMLKKYKHIAIQALPLLKNGCSKTIFDLNLLKEML